MEKNELRIGVVGYTTQDFDKDKALELIKETYDFLDKRYEGLSKVVVSGLTNIGMSAIAYQEAVDRGWKTVGIACSKAKNMDWFPVDKHIITGDKWGEESSLFLNSIDLLVRIGGGKQSITETIKMKKMGKPVYEHNLEGVVNESK